MKDVPSVDPNENYEIMYGNIDVKDKIVMDVGADYGSTASFFLKKGAKKIIAIEADIDRFLELIFNIENDDRVIPIWHTAKEPNKFSALLQKFRPEVVHMDCEFGESVLIELNNDIFKIPIIYQLEVHIAEKFLSSLIMKFLNNEYLVNVRTIYKNVNITGIEGENYGTGDIWLLTAIRS